MSKSISELVEKARKMIAAEHGVSVEDLKKPFAPRSRFEAALFRPMSTAEMNAKVEARFAAKRRGDDLVTRGYGHAVTRGVPVLGQAGLHHVTEGDAPSAEAEKVSRTLFEDPDRGDR